MKLNPNFISHQMDGQTLLVPTGDAKFHGLVQGNKTLAAILDCLTREISQEELEQTLCDRFEGDPAQIRAEAAEAVRRLRKIGAIDE